MPSLLKTGRIIVGTGFLGLIALSIHAGAWLVGRPAVVPGWLAAAWLPVNAMFLVLTIGMMFPGKYRRLAAFLTGCFIFVVSFLVCHIPAILHSDMKDIVWQLNAYKTLALAGGCWILCASFPGSPSWLNNKMLVATGWGTMALWLLIAGISHIHFNGFVRDFIPAYIPAHAFWSYFTAAALLAGGIGLLVNPLRQWAAFLSGLMILLWFFLLHIPRAAADPTAVGEWLGVCESFIFSGILFVLSALSRKQTI